MREDGYYWIRFGDAWEIAEYSNTDDGKGAWMLIGRELDIPADEILAEEIGAKVTR